MKQVKQNKLCFNCPGKHQVAVCLSKKTCRFCDRKHHSSVCSKNPLFKSDKETTIMYGNHERSDILLKTAIAEVESEGYCSYANILFDEGAQKSFITQKMADELNLRSKGTDTIRLASFGSKNEDLNHRRLNRAEIYLKTDNQEKVKLDVLIVSTIAAVPLQTGAQDRASKLPYLKGIKLAHPVTRDNEFDISLLISADQYWSVVEDKVIRGNGPTAVKSKLDTYFRDLCKGNNRVRPIIIC